MARETPIERYRNIGISAHVDAGKTTTTERILFFSGVLDRVGEVDDGTALMDWMALERERGISISAATTTCFWSVTGVGGAPFRINIIDTPGHVDFSGEVERSMRVLDGVCVVFDAVAGVQPQSEAVWRQADKYGVPRLAFINKMDRDGADFFEVVEQIRERLSIRPVPVQMPVIGENGFSGYVDLIGMRAMYWNDTSAVMHATEGEIPFGMRARASSLREQVIEAAADADEALMDSYVAGEEISAARLKSGLRAATIRRSIVPVLCGAAAKNKGIPAVLDAVVDFLPSPIDVPPVIGSGVGGEELTRRAEDSAPFSALAFKSAYDPADGPLTFFRVYSGVLSSGDSVYVPMLGKAARVDRLLQVHADQRSEIDQVFAGDIAAAVGLPGVRSGDTLCSPSEVIILDRMAFPEPVMHVAVEPKSDADAGRVDAALQLLVLEDPSLKVRSDPDSGQTIISGMGELHLEVIVDRLSREFGVELNVGKPQVAHKEGLTADIARVDTVLEDSTGTEVGRVSLVVEAGATEVEPEFLDNTDPSRMAPELVTSVREVALNVLSRGVVAGYPIVGAKVRLLRESLANSGVDLNVLRKQIEVSLIAALKGAKLAVFEPLMSVVADTPDESVGSVVGELQARGGRIVDMSSGAGRKVVKALVPLSEMFGFATRLRSLTRGMATHSMEFKQYAVMPDRAARAVSNSTT